MGRTYIWWGCHSHQCTRPRRIQKCDRHPFCLQTEGWSVGRRFSSMATSQHGFVSAATSSSIVSPHPHGQRIPTLQYSPSSFVRTRSRHGILSGSVSPSMTRTRLAGPYRSQSLRSHVAILIPAFSAFERPACRAAVPGSRVQESCSLHAGNRLRQSVPRRNPRD